MLLDYNAITLSFVPVIKRFQLFQIKGQIKSNDLMGQGQAKSQYASVAQGIFYFHSTTISDRV